MAIFDKISFPDRFVPAIWTELFNNNSSHKKILHSLKAKADAKRTFTERLADLMTKICGSFTFLALNVAWFIIWILMNTGLVPGITPFDPFPFSFLTMVVSLEAIILATFVLISQHRAGKIDDVREELHLQINMISEREITKLVELTAKLLEKNGVDLSGDKELAHILQPIHPDQLEEALKKEIA